SANYFAPNFSIQRIICNFVLANSNIQKNSGFLLVYIITSLEMSDEPNKSAVIRLIRVIRVPLKRLKGVKVG
ncbi:MAG: hypothetical protein IJ467_01140, partial [Bacteroidaceae bacterium]|nr:hypothetical protein [Bacteroidaceae bacterium]